MSDRTNPQLPLGIQSRLREIQQRIDAASRRAGRNPEEVTLMAVSKTQPLEALLEAYEAGLRLFGENRVAEGYLKRLSLPWDARIHLIGHLQSNKARQAVESFSSIQSIDKVSTLQALEKYLAPGQILPILVEVHTSGEEAKDGVRGWDDLLRLTEQIGLLPHFHLEGLMTMAPFTQDPGPIRRSFSALREFRDRLTQETGTPLPVLSMGMSGDFELAIEEGSTLVRVGTLLFGGRT